ncbi:MAG: ATP-binding protein [Nitriliruptorales bacterium]|nr:ATP-binding protein [Nitriliruptorales bacterium]
MHAVDAGDREMLGLPADRHLIDAEAEGHLLLELASSISGTLDLQEVLDKSLAALRRLISFNGGAIQLIEDGHLVAAATDPPMSEEARTVRIPVGVGISGSIAASGAAEYLPDILVDERIPEHARKHGVSGGVRSYFGVPLIMNGRPIGVLQVDSTRVDDFSARERALVLAFTPTITSAVQNARLFEAERIVAEQLMKADQLKRDFMAVVSHELRTPLTIMLGLSSTLVEFAATLEPDQVREFAARSGGAARRLQRLIDDLLFAADLDRGFLSVQQVPVELEQVIADVAAEHAGSVTPLAIDLAESLPRVTADPDRVHQVLSNIIGNAEKFAPTGTPIHLAATSADDGVRVTIQDDGPGIPEQHRQAIFDLFFQAEDVNRRTAGGLGIGLYVVKRLCDAMGVAIELDCPESGGTRFDLLFPVAEEPRWARTPRP